MERPDIRGALRELQSRGEIDIPSERWIIVIGEEDIIIGEDLPSWRRLRVTLFRLILRLSTPAHRFFGLELRRGRVQGADPGRVHAGGRPKVTLPELEIAEPVRV